MPGVHAYKAKTGTIMATLCSRYVWSCSTLFRYLSARMGISCLGFTPPNMDPMTDFPWRISWEEMERGAPCISTPRMIVLPHPCMKETETPCIQNLRSFLEIAAWRHECAYVSGAPKCVVHQRRQSNALEAVVRATVGHLDDRLLTIKTGHLVNVMFQYKGFEKKKLWLKDRHSGERPPLSINRYRKKMRSKWHEHVWSPGRQVSRQVLLDWWNVSCRTSFLQEETADEMRQDFALQNGLKFRTVSIKV